MPNRIILSYLILISCFPSPQGELKLSEKFTLKEVSLNMKVGDGAEFFLEGMCAIEFETSTQEFRGKIGVIIITLKISKKKYVT